jgi:ribosomal protein S18 acetylase RimI-like enzyme
MDGEVLEPSVISVRQMRDEDGQAVKTLAGRTFPPLGSALFPSSPNALVAEQDRKLVGAVVLRAFWLSGGRKCGVMFGHMSDPEARGLGVGGRLVGDALRYFEGQGCGEVFAGVEGYNTSSANIFAAHGFTVLSFSEQLRRYRLLGTFLLWLRTSHLGDVGHFLWVRPGQGRPDNPVLQWWVGTLMSVLVFLLAGWRGGWLGGFSLATILGVALIVVALFSLREVAVRLVARLGGLSVRHRAWESAFPLTLGVALAFGVFFPAPGVTEISCRSWARLPSLERRWSSSSLGVH